MSVVFDGSPSKAMQSSHSHTTATPSSAQELSQEIKSFISGVDAVQGRKLSVREHARCAVRSSRSVPACRGAVSEHSRGVYDEHVSTFLHNSETEGNAGSGATSNSEDIIQEVHGVSSEFIRLNPRAWAPSVSSWAVDSSGQSSSKHAGRRVAPHSSSLNESSQLWMSCAATRSLMEAYSQCSAAMSAWCPDACVDASSDTSVKHSPHFDWVVAHIGSAFPGTIISRVLACGSKDFCSHGAKDQGLSVEKGSRVPKIGSVVGISGHSAAHHSDSIRKESSRMFQESLTPSTPSSPTSSSTSWEASPQLRRAAVPFSSQLAAMSPNSFGAVSSESVESSRPAVSSQSQASSQGLPREESDNMSGSAVHLISQSPTGGARVLKFSADTATPASVIISGPTPSPHEGVREGCDRLLQMLSSHLHKLVFNRSEGSEVGGSASSQPQRVVPFSEESRSHVGQSCAETSRLERKRHLWSHQSSCSSSVYGGPSVATETLCQLLTQARNPEESASGWQSHATLSSCMAGSAPAAVAHCVAQIHTQTSGPRQLRQSSLNVAAAIQSQEEERKGAAAGGAHSSMAVQIGAAVSSHLHDFGPLLLHSDPAVSHAAVRLLSCSPLPRASSPAHSLSLSRAAVTHFFSASRRRGEAGKAGRDAGQTGEAVSCSVSLSSRFAAYSPLTSKAILQQSVEGASHKGNAESFGGQIADMSGAPVASPSVSPDSGASSSDINCRFGTTVNFSGSVWSVFHAGVIGRGLKIRTAATMPDPSDVIQNIQTLSAVIVQCCSSSSLNGSQSPADPDEPSPINAEAAKVVAVTSVENVCPDVANGESSWPPEEHARTTVERDIHIRRCFEAHPVLFPSSQVVAAGRPALCYCSAVLRGLSATSLSHWEGSREASSTDSPWHSQASCLSVTCMGEGQLSPPVLANVHEAFAHSTPFEVRSSLSAVWEYVRGNGPSPQKFVFSPDKGMFCRDFSRDGDVSRYVAPIHSVLHKNIDRSGHLCWRFQL